MDAKGYEFVLLAVVLWSFVAIIVRLLHPYISVESMLFYRVFIAAAVLILFVFITKIVKFREINRKKTRGLCDTGASLYCNALHHDGSFCKY